MSTKIRLARYGCKKNAFYKIVVQDSRKQTRGRAKQNLGYFDPHSNAIKIDIEAFNSWVSKGAQASDRVKSIVKKYEHEQAES